MTVAQSAKETEAEGLRCAQPEGEASNMRASEDILERAKASLKRHDPINQGFYTSMPPEDVQIWKELIAEVEAKNDKIAQDVITIQMHHENVLTLQKEVERLRSQSVEQVFRRKNEEITGLRARIKELEADKRRLEARVEYCHDQTKLIELLDAAFLKVESQRLWDLGKSTGETSYECQEAREALERIKEGGKDD